MYKSRLSKPALAAGLCLLINCSSQSDNMPTDGGQTPGPDAGAGSPDAGPTGPHTGPEFGTGPTPPATLPIVIKESASDCTIATPTTWTAGIYVVKCTLAVNATLTIDQGTIVKFDHNASMVVGAQGTIEALGGWRYPIAFTSLADDASGGDTNGDGAASAPAAGDWLGIEIGNGNFGVQVRTSSFQECRFYYGGQSDRSTLAAKLNPSFAVFVWVNVSYSVIAHGRTHTDALSAPPALDLRHAAGGTVANNVFFDNLVPLGISTNVTVDDTNAFDNSAAAPLAPEPNKYNAIVTGASPFGAMSEVHWSATQVPLVIGQLFTVANAPLPTLGEGVVLKFLPGGFFRLGGGTATSVLFTSIADDAHGGDTNGDGAATAPAPGDWSGVLVGGSGKVDHCQIYYAGDAAPFGFSGAHYLGAALQISDQGATNVTVTNSTFAHNRPRTAAATPTPAVVVTTAGAVVTGNVFYDNQAPLQIGGDSSLDDSNRFDNPAAPGSPQPNDVNGIFVGGDSALAQPAPPISTTIHWTATRVPFVLGNTSISGTGLLSLGDNVILKFAPNTGLVIAQGGTLATGNGDIFTSYLDDTHGGDTNGDGGATHPSATDWNGIMQFGSCATFVTEFFETCP